MRGLRALAAAALLAAFGVPAAQAADGAWLYGQHCAACHQPDASGAVGLAPPLKGSHWDKLGADRGYLPMVITHGLSGPIQVNGQPFVGSMPSFAGQLDDATIAAIATHLRSLQGAKGEAAYTEAEVAAARAAAGSPPQSRARRVELLGK